MGLEDLEPAALRKVLAALDVSHALVLDLVRGRPVAEEDVALTRQAIRAVNNILTVLDEQRPWDPV